MWGEVLVLRRQLDSMAVQWSDSRFQKLIYVPDIIEDTAAPSVPTEEAGLMISELQPFGAQLESDE